MVTANYIPQVKRLINVDINQYPTQFIDLPKNLSVEVALGDLHGNTLKLVFFLLTIRAISMTPEHYLKLVEAYNSLYDALPIDAPQSATMHDPALVKKKIKETVPDLLKQFYDIVKTITVTDPEKVDIATILVGDTVCDRGCLDLLTFHINKQKYTRNTTLISNHDMNLIKVIELDRSFNLYGLFPTQGRSTGALHLLVEAGLLTKDEIRNDYADYRKDFLAMHYNIDPHGKLKGIYTHAPMNMTEITKMAKGLLVYAHNAKYEALFPAEHKRKLSVAYMAYLAASEQSQVKSAHIIALMEVMNDLATYHLEHHTFHELANLGFEEEAYQRLSYADQTKISRGDAGDIERYPYHMIAWRRQPVAPDIQLADLPTGEFPGYVNGHDSGEHNKNAIVLDNTLGHSHHPITYDCGTKAGPKGNLTVTISHRLAPEAKKALVDEMVAPIFAQTLDEGMKATLSELRFTEKTQEIIKINESIFDMFDKFDKFRENRSSRNEDKKALLDSTSTQHFSYRAGPGTTAAAMMFCAIVSFVVASVIKNDMLGFMGMKSFEQNLVLSIAISAVATMGTYAATPRARPGQS